MPVDKFGRMSDTKTKDIGVSLTYINNNYIRSDGSNPVTGSIDMRGNTLYNVSDPVNPQDVVTKVYVDNTKGSGVIGKKIEDSVSIKENLDFLGKQKIKNLPDPVNDKDAVTKEYVDDLVTNHFIDENDNIAFGRDVDMDGNKIFSLPEPEQDSDPATKKYVDDLQNQYIDKRGNIKFSRNINLDNKRIFALKDPKKDYEATNKKYVDDSITKRLQEEKDNFLPKDLATKEYVDEAIKQLAGGDLLVSKEGVFIKANGHYRATAPLDIDNHKMENLPDPVDEKDAVNKKYIDGIIEALTLKQGLVRENGGFNLVDSYINMNFNNIRNVGLPKHEADAVPRSFVDDMVKTVEETTLKTMGDMIIRLGKTIDEDLKKIKHLISTTASYQGDLIKNDFQFTWGGQSVKSNKTHDIYNGFLVPRQGYIKSFEIEFPGLKFSSNTHFNLLDFERSLENTSLRVFSLYSIDRFNFIYEIGFFEIEFYFSGKTLLCNKKFSSKAPKDNIPLNKGTILNIRSDINTANLTEQYKYAIKTNTFNSNYNYYPIDDVVNEFFTYLVTILIELDPL